MATSTGEDDYLWITTDQRDMKQRPSLRSLVFLAWGYPAPEVTTQGLEELGLIGAESAARQSGCEMAIALDIGLADDVPGVDPRDVSASLGEGPTVVHKDLYAYNRDLTLALIRAAESAAFQCSLPYPASMAATRAPLPGTASRPLWWWCLRAMPTAHS